MTVGCSAKVAEVLVTWTTAVVLSPHAARSAAPTPTITARAETRRLEAGTSGGAGVRPASLRSSERQVVYGGDSQAAGQRGVGEARRPGEGREGGCVRRGPGEPVAPPQVIGQETGGDECEHVHAGAGPWRSNRRMEDRLCDLERSGAGQRRAAPDLALNVAPECGVVGPAPASRQAHEVSDDIPLAHELIAVGGGQTAHEGVVRDQHGGAAGGVNPAQQRAVTRRIDGARSE